MWSHMALLISGSVRPCGVSSSRSGEGSSVARAAMHRPLVQGGYSAMVQPHITDAVPWC